jgi:hypothetical protein
MSQYELLELLVMMWPAFMKAQVPPCSQNVATGPYPEPDNCKPDLNNHKRKINFNIILPTSQISLKGPFPSIFPLTSVETYAFLVASCCLDFIAPIIEYFVKNTYYHPYA